MRKAEVAGPSDEALAELGAASGEASASAEAGSALPSNSGANSATPQSASLSKYDGMVVGRFFFLPSVELEGLVGNELEGAHLGVRLWINGGRI